MVFEVYSFSNAFAFYCQYVTWSRGMNRMSEILILSYRLKGGDKFLNFTLFLKFFKECSYFCNQMYVHWMGFRTKCSILNGQVIYVKNQNWMLPTWDSSPLIVCLALCCTLFPHNRPWRCSVSYSSFNIQTPLEMDMQKSVNNHAVKELYDTTLCITQNFKKSCMI